MKKNNKNLNKTVRAATHKRRAKEKYRREVIRALEAVKVEFEGFTYREKSDTGRKKPYKSRKTDTMCVLGTYTGTRSGFGFVTPDGTDGSLDVFIPEGETCGAIDGDYVECHYRLIGRYSGGIKTEGSITKIIKYGKELVVGTVALDEEVHGYKRSQKPYLIPDEKGFAVYPTIRNLSGANVGDKVEARILRDTGGGYGQIECSVERVFGSSDALYANYMAILSGMDISTEFSDVELAEAERVAAEPVSEEGRVTYPGAVIFTIDGDDAKDLDDAVSIKKHGNGYRLGVHIADVSHYVRDKSSLMRLAMHRGTSIYFTDKVVPMLPPVLSNHACSLNPGEKKYAISAIIDVDANGAIEALKLERSVIVSRMRCTYREVNEILLGNASADVVEKYRPVIPSLQKMHGLYLKLFRASQMRGALELEVGEAKILLDEQGAPVDIIKRERKDAEKMIEQFMLLANTAVADKLSREGIPAVFRVHAPPPKDKLGELLRFAGALGLNTGVVDGEGRGLDVLLREAEKKGLLSAISYTALRSLSKAEYSEKLSMHFGLAMEKYCHFTSPIRRLADLATHRIINDCFFDKKDPLRFRGFVTRAASAATDTELTAVAAERKIENLYKAAYMRAKIGEVYFATVSGVCKFGVFAELDNTVEGLIPLSEMPGYFVFDERTSSVMGLGMRIKMGDVIKIKVEEALLSQSKIRFSLVL